MDLTIDNRCSPYSPFCLQLLCSYVCTRCDEYKEGGPLDVNCAACGHIHREYNSYADLEGVACILILVDKGRMGDTFPSTLVAMDLRLSHQDTSTSISYLSTFVQEMGRLCRCVISFFLSIYF